MNRLTKLNKQLNKKGKVALLGLAIAAFILLGIIIYSTIKDKPVMDFIGVSQINILNTYEFAEKSFLYIDAASSIAVMRAAEKTALEGGMFKEEAEGEHTGFECGSAVYPILNKDSTRSSCKENFDDNFKHNFKKEFYPLIQKYRFSSLLSEDFILTIKHDEDMKILIESNGDMEFPILSTLNSYQIIGDASGIRDRVTAGDYTRNIYGYTERSGLLSASRGNAVLDSVVLHYTVTKNVEVAYNALKERGLSYHYIIDKDGKIYQFVPEDRAAQHAGCSGKTQAVTCEPGWNARSAGISFVNCGYDNPLCRVECDPSEKINGKCWDAYTDAQIDSAAKLISEISQRNPGFRISDASIKTHEDISSDKSDTGPALNKQVLIQKALEHYNAKVTT